METEEQKVQRLESELASMRANHQWERGHIFPFGTFSTGTMVMNFGSFSASGNSVSMSKEDFENIIKFIPIENFDCKLILKIPNAHIKQILIKHVGWERVLQKCGGKELDSFEDELTLYEMNLGQFSFGRPVPVKILKCKDPSSGLFYCLRVPPGTKTCKEAKAWTFEEDNLDYIQEA